MSLIRGGSGVKTIVAGTNITVDATDPRNPIVSATGGGGGGSVDSVNGATGVVVLDTDDIDDTATNRYTNDTDITRLANTSGTNTGDQNLFSTIAVSGQTDVVADSTTDTLTLVAGSNITITTDATTDSITIASTGGGGGVTSVSGTTNRITSTGGTTPAIDISATFEALLGKVANPLSQFASTTSAQLAGVLSDETGSGVVVFNTNPVLTAPDIGAAVGTSLNVTNTVTASSFSGAGTGLTGTAASLTAGTVTTNANLTGVVTSIGNATAIADGALSIAKTSGLQTALDGKQATLVSGTNIKTLNSTTILGSGDIAVATTAQGALADSALQPSDIGVTVQGYSAVLAATTASFTTADETKLDGIEAGAQVNAIDTVSDTSEIDLNITAKALSASIIAGSIDETKLDASVNASLDLADTALQSLAGTPAAISFQLNGQGSAITTALTSAVIRAIFGMTITKWEIDSDVSGSIVIDVLKNGSSITASAPPTLSTATNADSTTLTGWTTSIAAEDLITIEVDAATTVELVTLTLYGVRT